MVALTLPLLALSFGCRKQTADAAHADPAASAPPVTSSAAPPVTSSAAPSTGPSAEETASVAIDIAGSGVASVDGVAMTDDDQLEKTARAAATKASTSRALVRADATAASGRVKAILNRLKAAGLSKIALTVVPAGSPSASK